MTEANSSGENSPRPAPPAAEGPAVGSSAPWARPSAPWTDAGTASPAEDDFETEPPVTVDRWLHQVDVYTGPDALLDFNQVDNVHIDLTQASPSGYAQLLSGRKTRLSTILRDRSALAAGMRSAEAIREKIYDLKVNHGLDAGFLAAGMASWLTQDHIHDFRAPQQRHIAPVLLVPIVVSPHRDGEDFELRLSGSPRINPALARQLRGEYGIDLHATGAADRGLSGSRVTPDPMIDQVRTDCAQIPGMQVDETTVISTFADLSDTVGQLPERAAGGLMHRLSELARADGELPQAPPRFQRPVTPVDRIDPDDEVLVYDADETVSEIVERAKAGYSMTVSAPPGTEPLRAALNVAGTLIEQGKNVLLVSERTSTLAEVRRRISRLGLDGLSLVIDEAHLPEELTKSLVASIVAHEQAQEPSTETNHAELREVRENLRHHVDSLHWTDARWGISPYQAMQTLAELTSRDPAPSTRVRFKRAVLDATQDRTETVAQLERAAELRAFSKGTRKAPWYGARLVNAEETKQARALVRHLAQKTRELGEAMERELGVIGLVPEPTIQGWLAQIDLLEGVKTSLDSFSKDVFDRPVTDLIAATAGAGWRRERGIEMSPMQRSKLRRTAKEYILPQVHIADLHTALLAVQEQRERWRHWAADHRQVSVPRDIQALRDVAEHLREEFAGLSIVMEASPARLDYLNTEQPELLDTLDRMAGDRFLLDTLPEREQLVHVLRGKGLGELLQDLEDRAVSVHDVAAELDLAWWQSAFEIMLAHPEVSLASGTALNRWENAFRRVDYTHLTSGPARIRYGAARGWNREVNLKPVQARALRQLLKGAPKRLRAYLDAAPEILGALKPLWISSPFGVGRALPPGSRVDAVILLDAEASPLGANLAALARTSQVIAFGDTQSGYPQPFIVSPALHQAEGPSTEPVESAMEVLERILPSAALTRVHDCWDSRVLDLLNRNYYQGRLRSLPFGEEAVSDVRSLRVDYLHGGRGDDYLGAPMADSPSQEVSAVVEMVLDHAARNPRQSLAVLTPSPRHAARINEGLQAALRSRGDLLEFFRPGGSEPFRILDLRRAQGVRRDRIIFSLGVSPAAGGAPEHFGQLADDHGRRRLVMALTAGRFHTRIVSSLSLEQLQGSALSQGMIDLVQLLSTLEQDSGITEDATRPAYRRSPEGSPFLSTYDATRDEEEADWLLADLSKRLRLSGADVALTPGYEIDGWASAQVESLSAGAIRSPRVRTSGPQQSSRPVAGRIPVALCTDGTEEYRRASVRERSRLRPERLERTGWNYMPLWTVDVFADPQAVAGRILRFLGLAKGDDED